MIPRINNLAFAFVVAFFLAGHSTLAGAAERVLLVASDYTDAEDETLHLANPVRDARQIENAFRKAGQENVRLVAEPDLQTMNQAIDAFVATVGRDDVAIVYFAGHAVQFEGENYFLAGDGKSLVSFNALVKRVSDSSRASIFLVDACRNNPFAARANGRSIAISDKNGQTRDLQTIAFADLVGSRGLAQLSDIRGLSTVVFFSTEPGNVALDGDEGDGSPFAKSLAKEIRKRQSLDDLLKRTAIEVNRVTNGQQSPWRQGDIPFDIFIAGMKSMAIP